MRPARRRADAGASPSRRRARRVPGGDDLGLAQPVPRQRHQAVRRRAARSCPTRSRPRIEAALDVAAARRRGRPGADRCGRRRRRPTAYVEHLARRARRARALDGLRVVRRLRQRRGVATLRRPRAAARSAPTSSVIHAAPDGRNINAGCGATAPGVAGRGGRRPSGADLGLALDGDADRLIAVDHTGDVVDGDHIIAICAVDLRDARRAARRHRRRHRDDEPRLPARRWRRPGSRSSRPRSATATCSRRSTPAATRSAASSAATSSSATSPPPATGCSTGLRPARRRAARRAGRWPSSPRRR